MKAIQGYIAVVCLDVVQIASAVKVMKVHYPEH